MRKFCFLLFWFFAFRVFAYTQINFQTQTLRITKNEKVITVIEDSIGIDSAIQNRTQKPLAQKSLTFKVGKAKSFVLKNGLKIYVVEKANTGIVDYRLYFNQKPFVGTDDYGKLEMTKLLMGCGTTKKTKKELDESLSLLNAKMYASEALLSIQSSPENEVKITELFAEIILHPKFDAEEMSILKAQQKALKNAMENYPDYALANISNILNYGKYHPYSEVLNEAIIQSMIVKDCKDFYKKFFNPNACFITITGNVDAEEIKIQLENLFNEWQNNTNTELLKPEMPALPLRTKFTIVNSNYVGLSYINFTHPLKLELNNPDVFKLQVLNTILGANARSRLYINFMQQKTYASSLISSIEGDNIGANFSIKTVVNNNAIDTLIKDLLMELHAIQNEKISWQEMLAAKNFIAGEFIASLENPLTLALFTKNIEAYNLPADYYQNYLNNINRVNIKDIAEVANKYLFPNRAHIIIVGNKSEILKKINKIKQIPYELVDMYDVKESESAERNLITLNGKSVIKNYIKAIGGQAQWKKITSLKIKQEALTDNQKMTLEKIKKYPNKYLLKVKVGDIDVQKIIINGNEAIEKTLQGIRPIKGREFELLYNDAYIYPEHSYDSASVILNLKGIEKINDEMAYVVEVINKRRRIIYEYFSVNTNLKIRTLIPSSSNITARSQILNYQDYKDFEGLLFPTSIITKTKDSETVITVTDIVFNEDFNDSMFNLE